jgi:hypothetical protein
LKPRRLAAFGLYLLLVALFLEGAARLALSNEAFLARAFANDDTSWRLRWSKRHQKLGRIYYEFDEWSPTRGWALKANVRDVALAPGKRLNSNGRGLRGAREYSYEKPPGVTRIVVLGDSFTFGEDVDDSETYSRQLETMLPGVEVLNLGVHGYGHDQMLVYLREEGLRYKPDVVLLGFLSDDMERNVLGFRDYAKPRFVLEDGHLVLRGSPVPPPEETMAAEPWRSRFVDLLRLLQARWRWRSGRTSQETKDVSLALLDEIQSVSESAGARPAFAYLPVYGELTRTDPGMTARERFFFAHCRERGVQTMYLRPFFEDAMKHGAELKTYGHWGAQEHHIAALGMRRYLLEKGFVRLAAPELVGEGAGGDLERGIEPQRRQAQE